MNGPVSGLTPAQDERLTLLIEECAEVIKVATKIQRFGYNSFHPLGIMSNRELLEHELGDVATARRLLEEASDVSVVKVEAAAAEKYKTVGSYLNHQGKA